MKTALLFILLFAATLFAPKAHAQIGPWPCGGNQSQTTFRPQVPYVTGNVVEFYGIFYQAVQGSTGQNPCNNLQVNSTYWTQQVGASGPVPPTGQQFAPVLDASNCALSTKPSWCNGTDIGAWVTAASTYLGSNYGAILVDASVASYNQTTSMKINLKNQLYCQGTPIYWQNNSGEAVILAGPELVGATTLISGCNFIGHGTPSAVTDIGLYLGGDPAGVISPSGDYADLVTVLNTQFWSFNKGVTNGNNVWLLGLHSVRLQANTFGIYANVNGATNTGEEMVIYGGSAIYNGGTGIYFNGTGAQWRISDTSFDYNTVADLAGNVNADLKSVHFEGHESCPIAPTGLTLINIIGGDWYYAQASTAAPGLICPASPSASSLYNVSGFGLNTGGAALTNLIYTGLSSSVLFCPYTQNFVLNGAVEPDSWVVDSTHFACGSQSH